MNNNESKLDDLLDALNTFSEHMYENTKIVMGNPETLLKLDMNEFYSNVWFISHPFCKETEMLIVKDDELKRTLYNFIEKHPDRVFRGKKESKEKI